ncbi:MAG: PEGA domain-containing protein [bacterium]
MKEEQKKNRTFRLIRLMAFILVFIIITPFIVSYAIGDMPDGWFNFRKTGGIYLFDFPNGSEVYLDGQLKKTTNFIQRDFFVKGLKPNTSYDLSVKKEGYNNWNKIIKVEPNLVTESSVFSLPIVIPFTEVPQYIVGTKEKKVNTEYTKVSQVFSKPLSVDYSKDFSSSTINFSLINLVIKRKSAIWSDGRDIMVRWLGEKGQEPLMFCENHVCRTESVVASLPGTIKKLDFLPGRTDVVVVLVGKDIYAVEICHNNSKILQKIYTGTDKANFIIYNDNIYIKDGVKIGYLEI